MNVELTKISPKGQVVIPQSIRNMLKIRPGMHFAVYGQGENIIFKKIELPSVEDFRALTKETSRIARKRKITKKDIEEAIYDVRTKK